MPLANHASEPVVDKPVTEATMHWFGLLYLCWEFCMKSVNFRFSK